MYVVTQTCNFDYEKNAWICETEKDAENLLHEKWEDYYNTEIAEGFGDLDEAQCYHEDDYATVTWYNGDRTEFHMIEIETLKYEETNRVWNGTTWVRE